MSQITLDELEVTSAANGVTYDIQTKYNEHTGTGELKIESTYDASNTKVESIFDNHGFGKIIKPNLINVDFKSLKGDLDMLDLVLINETIGTTGAIVAKNYIVNHVAINDTKYPPPYNTTRVDGEQKTLSENLKVTELKIERNTAPKTGFDVSITLEKTTNAPFYKIGSHGISIHTDTCNQNSNVHMKAIVLHVQKTDSLSPLSFNFAEMDLAKFYGGGIPIIVAETDGYGNFVWPEITMKKGVISIQ